ncbi:hypothetical protein, partial [Xanthomonas phaseoli]
MVESLQSATGLAPLLYSGRLFHDPEMREMREMHSQVQSSGFSPRGHSQAALQIPWQKRLMHAGNATPLAMEPCCDPLPAVFKSRFFPDGWPPYPPIGSGGCGPVTSTFNLT